MDDARNVSAGRRNMIAGLGLAAAGAALGAGFTGPARAARLLEPGLGSTALATATAKQWSALIGDRFLVKGYRGSLRLVRVERSSVRGAPFAREPFTATFEASGGPIEGDSILTLADPRNRPVRLHLGPSVRVGGRVRLVAAFS